jgi:hypothetical protein
MKPIEEEFNCFGHWWFGNGIAMGRFLETTDGKLTEPVQATYCNKCPMSQACWERHREFCREKFKDLMVMIEKMLALNDNRKEYRDFINEHKGGDPMIQVMVGNMEDAMHILATGKPKDRGELTLKYPFEYGKVQRG